MLIALNKLVVAANVVMMDRNHVPAFFSNQMGVQQFDCCVFFIMLNVHYETMRSAWFYDVIWLIDQLQHLLGELRGEKKSRISGFRLTTQLDIEDRPKWSMEMVDSFGFRIGDIPCHAVGQSTGTFCGPMPRLLVTRRCWFSIVNAIVNNCVTICARSGRIRVPLTGLVTHMFNSETLGNVEGIVLQKTDGCQHSKLTIPLAIPQND